MAKKKKTEKYDGIVVRRDVDKDGYVYAWDKNDRACWGGNLRERVVLTHDLRKYAAGLHIGQLGWTVPETSDAYKWVDVLFDNGVQLPILTYGIQRIDHERASEISERILKEHENTRFDADPEVAKRFLGEWIKAEYAHRVDTERTVELGEGHEEIYAFTFPSLRELAALKNAATYPIKIGYATDKDVGAIARISNQINEAAAFPERPTLILVYRTWNARALEASIHAELRRQEKRIETAPGAEWFMTNDQEVMEICQRLGPDAPKVSPKPMAGASPGLADMIAAGARVEFVQYPDSACVGIRIIDPEPDPKMAPSVSPIDENGVQRGA